MPLSVIAGPIAPILFGVLIAAATVAVWFALAPARPAKMVTNRLDGYVDRSDFIKIEEMKKSLGDRVAAPFLQRILRFLGGLLPNRNLEQIAEKLSCAGNPGNLTALDYMGLRILAAAMAGGGYLAIMGRNDTPLVAARNAFVAVFAGYMLPKLWLNQKIKRRSTEIERALPDALDMLTIGVEAGLAFESAMLRVGDQWNNALSQEFRRVVSEMRIGVSRNDALRHMAERTRVEALSTFVAILIQSNMLGVSIAQVLHTQSDQMRVKRRQHAEEQAHAATVKIVVVLILFIFPSLFIVIMGPMVPRIMSSMQAATIN